MKKLIILALLAVIMAGCEGTQRNQDGSIVLDTYWKEHSIDNPYSATIDSCEYIFWNSRMAHKGNCKYCAARRKAEIRELVKQLKEK